MQTSTKDLYLHFQCDAHDTRYRALPEQTKHINIIGSIPKLLMLMIIYQFTTKNIILRGPHPLFLLVKFARF